VFDYNLLIVRNTGLPGNTASIACAKNCCAARPRALNPSARPFGDHT
jgi:hypothetical protein